MEVSKQVLLDETAYDISSVTANGTLQYSEMHSIIQNCRNIFFPK